MTSFYCSAAFKTRKSQHLSFTAYHISYHNNDILYITFITGYIIFTVAVCMYVCIVAENKIDEINS